LASIKILAESVSKLKLFTDFRIRLIGTVRLVCVLRRRRVTSALIGESRPSQIVENVKACENIEFSDEELNKIDAILNEKNRIIKT
jgi:L-glyceraldehyde 3-phosphate reductase